MISDIKIGKIHFISHQYRNVTTQILRFADDIPENFKPYVVVGKLLSRDLFLPLEIMEVNHLDIILDDKNKIWVKVLAGNVVGWIKIYKTEIYELNPGLIYENYYLLDKSE